MCKLHMKLIFIFIYIYIYIYKVKAAAHIQLDFLQATIFILTLFIPCTVPLSYLYLSSLCSFKLL